MRRLIRQSREVEMQGSNPHRAERLSCPGRGRFRRHWVGSPALPKPEISAGHLHQSMARRASAADERGLSPRLEICQKDSTKLGEEPGANSQARPSRRVFYCPHTRPRMARSTCWSLLALGLAMLNYVMHRDISCNVFFATFIFIQALKRPAEDDKLVIGRLMEFAATAGAALLTFAILSRLLGVEWVPPASW